MLLGLQFYFRMSGFVPCNTCFADVFRGTLFKFGYGSICKQIVSLHGQIADLESLVYALQAEIRCPAQPFYSIELPQPQSSCKRRAMRTAVRSGRVRAVTTGSKHVSSEVPGPCSAAAQQSPKAGPPSSREGARTKLDTFLTFTYLTEIKYI